jgi:hypothetical protein
MPAMTAVEWNSVRAPTLLAPPLLAMALVNALFTDSAGHWNSALRALIVAGLVGLLIGIVSVVLIQRVGPATLAGVAAVLLLAGDPFGGIALLAILLWLVIGYWRRLRDRTWPAIPPVRVAQFAGLILTGSLVIVIPAIAADGFSARPAEARAASADRPSIYILLLDGYPRADTLNEAFDYDNAAFLAALEAQGFTVYPDATSPATRAERTLLAMLSVADDESSPEPAGWLPISNEHRRDTRLALGHAAGADLLRQAGYSLIRIASPVVHTNFDGWNERDAGHVNEIEIKLIQRSPVLARLLGDWVMDQLRERIVTSLQTVAEIAAVPGQKAVLAHILAPHAPFVFDADGQTAPPLDCWLANRCNTFEGRASHLGIGDEEYRRLVLNQLKAVNLHTLSTLGQIVEADPSAVVVVLSDHGQRHDEDPDEWHRSFLAARGTSVFDGASTSAHLFERILAER